MTLMWNSLMKGWCLASSTPRGEILGQSSSREVCPIFRSSNTLIPQLNCFLYFLSKGVWGKGQFGRPDLTAVWQSGRGEPYLERSRFTMFAGTCLAGWRLGERHCGHWRYRGARVPRLLFQRGWRQHSDLGDSHGAGGRLDHLPGGRDFKTDKQGNVTHINTILDYSNQADVTQVLQGTSPHIKDETELEQLVEKLKAHANMEECLMMWTPYTDREEIWRISPDLSWCTKIEQG